MSERLSPKAMTEEYCGLAEALEAAITAMNATSNLVIELFIIPSVLLVCCEGETDAPGAVIFDRYQLPDVTSATAVRIYS